MPNGTFRYVMNTVADCSESYSKEYKFRPAASPIVTETLIDGRLKLRGALQTPTATPTPVKKAKSKRKRTGTKRSKKTKKAAKN
jgi:hypothetical protein